MTLTKKKLVEALKNRRNFKWLKHSEHALERECLRIDAKGNLSSTPHPKAFGAPLTNPYISTDFSESQLEFITPVYIQEQGPITFLKELLSFAKHNIKDEYLWPFSMPSILPKNDKKIPLAEFGKSQIAERRTEYRRGLGERYGRKMQTVSGIHYNFSFSAKFWNFLYKNFGENESKREFIDKQYFKMARNFLEISWLDSYLFGASPIIHKSYLNKKHKALKKYKDSYYGEYATSLRRSEIGYNCEVQSNLCIPFNSVEDYVGGLKEALSKPVAKYKNLRGLNENILQIPNEYYASIRPKQHFGPKGNILDSLMNKGVQYLEIRTVDLDPQAPLGITLERIQFLNILMLYCLLKENNSMTCERKREVTENNNVTALYGRKPGIKLNRNGKTVSLIEWGREALKGMREAAHLLDQNVPDERYCKILKKQFKKLEDPQLTPSAKILSEIIESKKTFIDFALLKAKEHMNYLLDQKENPKREKTFKEIAKKSLTDLRNIELESEQILLGYEGMERSTQIIIREALKRGIKVEVLDRAENFIRLSKGKKVEYVKQATKTSKDSYITFLILENKIVAKKMMQEKGIKTPEGESFMSHADALNSYEKFSRMKVVIKPASTNFGVGISFASNRKQYEEGVHEAFKHSKSVIVEEFVEGKEYRFLVIGNKIIGIIHRMPANIIGDGKHTISELIDMKNTDPLSFKTKKEYIQKGKIEKAKLAEQNFQLTDIPPKNKQVFLRDNSNVSTGGDSFEVSHKVSKKYCDIAVMATNAVGASICGVDMIIQNPNAKPNHKNHAIIELNFNPVLKMHEFPYKGKGQPVAPAVLRALGF